MIDNRALSDTSRENVPFFASEQSTGIASLKAFDSSHQPIGTVTTATLGAIISEYEISNIDLLKIDMEGYDLFISRGLPENIQPRVIVCEFEDKKTVPLGYTYSDLSGELVGRGYHVILSEW